MAEKKQPKKATMDGRRLKTEGVTDTFQPSAPSVKDVEKKAQGKKENV